MAFFALAMCPQSTFAKESGIDLSARYIKLARSYREAGDVDNAFKYVKKSKVIIETLKQSFHTKYWTAAAEEELFYLYCKIGEYERAGKCIDKAYYIYEQIIDQIDGSPLPISKIRDNFYRGDLPFCVKNCGDDKGTCTGTNDRCTKGGAKQGGGCKKSSSYQECEPGYDNVENKDRQNDKYIDISPNATNVSANNCNFTDVPREIYTLKILKQLSLANNQITDVNLFGLRSAGCLEYLDLSNNNLEEFNGDFKKMHNLRYLNLSDNPNLSSLPSSLENLKSLKVLDISGCNFPAEMVGNLIRKLSDTQIITDSFIKEEEDDEDDEDDEANWY